MKMMRDMHVQAILDSLNERFRDLLISSASKLFSLQYYPSDEEVHMTMPKQWLESTIIKIGLITVGSDANRAKLLQFVEITRHECEIKSLYETW